MSTRMQIVGLGAVLVIAAGWAGQPAVAAIFGVGAAIIYLLHAVEVKLNRLLDDRGIFVSDRDIERD